jgi:hypothetical protein
MLNGIHEHLGMVNTYDVWYKTPKRSNVKRKSFDSITELTKWCKQNKGKVKIKSGSYNVFEIMDSLNKTNIIENEEDYTWNWGKNKNAVDGL